MTKTQTTTPAQALADAVYNYAMQQGSERHWFIVETVATEFFRSGGTREQADEITDAAYEKAGR